jgi:DNA-binding GntR family transcriptional regulator
MSKSGQPASRLIALEIEKRISEGLLENDLPLRQAELAKEFGTSHIPVREALSALAEKGLVQIIPNKGAVVAPLSAHQCRELADMRVALETVAIRSSVPKLTDSHLAEARATLVAIHKASTPRLRAVNNWSFHRSLYAAAERPFLMSHLEKLWMHADRYLQFTWAHLPYEARSEHEHEAILLACEARDVRSACRLTTDHILGAALAAIPLLERMAKSHTPT